MPRQGEVLFTEHLPFIRALAEDIAAHTRKVGSQLVPEGPVSGAFQ